MFWMPSKEIILWSQKQGYEGIERFYNPNSIFKRKNPLQY